MRASEDPLEAFRVRRENQLFEHRFAVLAAATRQEVSQLIAQNEKLEEVSREVAKEMNEFFVDSTRIAARVFASMEEESAQAIERKVLDEMQQFFSEMNLKVSDLVEGYCAKRIEPKAVEKAFDEILRSAQAPLEAAASAASEIETS